MEVEGEKPSSLPSNYVTIHQLKERWLQQQQQSPSKPEPENPKPKPIENAITPTNTQNQIPNFGRVTKEHKPKEVKVDDIGSTSKTLVVDDMNNPNKNDATKHNQRPNYRPVINQPKPKVDYNGSTSKNLVAEVLKHLKIKPMADDDGSSTKALVVDVTDNLLNGENETGDSKSNPNLKKKKKKSKHRRRNPNVVTDQNPTRAEPEPGAKVVEEKMEIKIYPTDKNPEMEMVEEKGKEGRRYGRRNGKGNLRSGAEPEQKVEPEQEAEVVEEKMEKKSYGCRKPAEKNPNGAELKPEMEEEVVVEKGKWGRRNGNSRVVWEQKEKTAPVDGNNGGGGGGIDGVAEEVVKEMNVGQGRDKNGDYGRDKTEDYGRDRKGGHGRNRNGSYRRDRYGGYERFQKSVARGSFGEQKGQIWVKKGESVVPN